MANALRGIDDTIERYPQETLLRAFVSRLMHRAENGLVLDWRRNDRSSPFRLESAPGAQNGEVVGLSTARGEADLVRPCA